MLRGIPSGLRLGLTLWRVQSLIFLNQTLRSRQPSRIVGFVLGVLFVLFLWINEGVLVLFGVSARPGSGANVVLTEILSVAFLLYTAILLFSSLLFSLNALLLNPDLEVLLVAPRPVESVLAARMVVQILRMLVLSLVFLLPALLILTVSVNPAVLPGFVALFLLYPVVPVVVVSVLTLALVRLIPQGRGKEVITILGIALALGVNVVNFLFNPAFRNPGVHHAGVRALAPDIPLASAPFMPPAWAGRAAAGILTQDWASAAGWGLVLLTVSAVVFVSGALASGRLYRAGWIQTVPRRARLEVPRRRRGWAVPGLDPVAAAIVGKDWRMRTRDVAQLARFAMPVVFLALLLGLRAQGLISMVRSIGPGPASAMLALTPSWVLLLSLSGGLGLTAVSLEGRAVWIYAASPNGVGRFLYGKCWAAALPTTVATVGVALVMETLIRPGWPWAAGALVVIALQSGSITALLVAIGGFWARFDWTDARRMMHPAAAVAGLIAQLGISGATAILGLGSLVLAHLLHLSIGGIWISALFLSAAGTMVLAYASLVLAADKLRALEVT